MQISHGCLTSELQKFPILKKRMSEVVSSFLRDGLRPAETMITHIIAMEMDYINTSHPSFVGGTKVVELAKHEVLPPKTSASLSVHKDGTIVGSECESSWL
jgi:dynamin 1-like protein